MTPLTFKKQRKIKRQEMVFAILLAILSSCTPEPEIDETEIMFTICIDGYKHLSVFNGQDCYYHKLKRECK